MRASMVFGLGLALVFLVCTGGIARGDFTWAGGSGNWTDGNWGQGASYPGEDDTVIINSGTVLLDAETAELLSFTMGGGTLVMSNWNTRLRAATVTISGSGDRITLPPAFTNAAAKNRVWINCTDFTLNAGATIDADGKGWDGKRQNDPVGVDGYGPGAGRQTYSSAGYGGYGNRQAKDAANGGGVPYGSVATPTEPGSGGAAYQGNGYIGGAGGGAVRIDAIGDVIIDGTITANGQVAPNAGGGGSGGGIYITCRTIAGAGAVQANGRISSGLGAGGGQIGAGGGRIAVDYDSDAQALISVPMIIFSAGSVVTATATDDPGEIGTLHFTDERFLQRVPLTGFTGQWHSASANLSFTSLTVSNAWLRFVKDGISLTVENDLCLTTGARLEVGGNVTYSNFYRDVSAGSLGTMVRPLSEMTSNPEVKCANLTLTSGGSLWIYGGLTNGTTVQTGALVKVSGTLTIATNSWLHPVSHGTNGGPVVLSLGGMTIGPGGGINADGKGFGVPGSTPAGDRPGYGPGRGTYSGGYIGAGYGGKGGGASGSYGQTYGSSNIPPYSCGSGGGVYAGGYNRAGSGGGLVWIDAALADITVNGTISAVGGNRGSGGGVYIVCQGFAGSGLIRADGGVGASPGGGGRIGIFRRPTRDTFTTGGGVYSVLAGSGTPAAETGTVYLGVSDMRPMSQGTVVIIF